MGIQLAKMKIPYVKLSDTPKEYDTEKHGEQLDDLIKYIGVREGFVDGESTEDILKEVGLYYPSGNLAELYKMNNQVPLHEVFADQEMNGIVYVETAAAALVDINITVNIDINGKEIAKLVIEYV